MNQEEAEFLDNIINYLNRNADSDEDYVMLKKEDLLRLCRMSIDVIKEDPTLLRLEAPLKVCGDVHGQFTDLMKFLKIGGDPKEKKYLFMGDYVDRGRNSVCTITMLLALKCRYPTNVFLLRGNHETRDISRLYGFFEECYNYYDEELWEAFNAVFDYMPLAAIISGRIFCVHGGLSKDLSRLEDIESLKRPLDVPDSGLIADLLWADPSAETHGYEESERGMSYTFGPDVAKEFLQKNDFDLVCRAHQVVNDGFEFPFYPEQNVVTVFSAPNYCEEFGNKGAMLCIGEELSCSFKFVDPPNCIPHPNARPVTPAY